MNSKGLSRVTPLNEGALFVTKRMEATAEHAMPRHTASVESVLVVTSGHCVVAFDDARHSVSAGDSFVVPAGVAHQVIAAPEFVAVHVMPKEIRFDFTQ